MPEKYTYFNLRGRGELTRLLFAYKNYPFEDDRIEYPDWPTRKPTTPLGCVPVITFENGDEYCQSTAIARYFATKFDLIGKTPEENLLADMIVDTIRVDMWPLFVNIFLEGDEVKKAALKVEASEKTLHWLSKMNDKYIRGEGTILSSGLSWADFALFNCVNDLLPVADMTLDSSLTKVKAVYEKVAAEPTISDWVAKRPKGPF